MKKIFLFATAAMAALTLNAASFVGFDGRDGTLGVQIHDEGLIQNAENITLNETDTEAHKYEIKITVGGECSFTMGGIKFWYKNSNDGTIAFKSFGTYIQPNGNKRSVTIPTVPGEKVRIYVASDQAGVALEGATVDEIDLEAWGSDKDIYNVIEATGDAIVMWSDDRSEAYNAAKFKLGAVLPDEAQGVENAKAEVKAVKRIVDGQVVIEREGRLYNLLGAEL